ncbi:MAG: 6-bladed beta-propeller [Bacteroidetes bacterium]|jgi:hypothetical protein|nr:6-bladed beta-propeller [Bacteroidota bacterium]MBT3748077.1 6-bladed beta-propeller [Bacteroidota bacterium]MBT4400739.1 6-bladed beta-propeller [Bacteroidota bacterium]MBT4411022.1 6-bladed beta-propeller [Bacteroidota bacterium]MBT5425646.1 6-bladed beta-propeller [Bacteroidota bacterium]
MQNYLRITLLSLITITTLSCGSPDEKEKESSAQKNNQELPQQVKADSLYHVDMEDIQNQGKDIYLSDIVKSIEYIPLETTNKYLIGETKVKIKPCAEYIFVGEHGKPLGVFSRSGKFIKTIGTIGKGPGEYNFDYDFWPDEKSRTVYIANATLRAITGYSFDGEHIRDIKPEIAPVNFIPMGDNQFLTWFFIQQEHEGGYFRYFIHDTAGIISQRFLEDQIELKRSARLSILSPHMMNSPNGVLCNSWEEDYILRATPDGRFEPALSWSLGKYKMPFDPMEDFDRYDREKHKYIRDINGMETRNNWYLKFFFKNKLEFAVFEKASGKISLVSNPDYQQEGVQNDYDGGPSFWPFWYTEKGQYFFKLIQSVDLIEGSLEQEKNIVIKNKEAANRYRVMISNLSTNSNPVLMIVELK